MDWGTVSAATIFVGQPQSGQTVTSFAFAIQLNDNDGKGRKAWMTWGAGLHPAWQPKRFGVVTLVKRILL